MMILFQHDAHRQAGLSAKKLTIDGRRPHLRTTTKAGRHANRNAGFIRQAGEWHWGCRMNPAFRWLCQDAPMDSAVAARAFGAEGSKPFLNSRRPRQASLGHPLD